MTPANRSLAGMALVAIGWLMAVAAGLLVWSSVQRWSAANELREAAQRARVGKVGEARRLAGEAAERLPAEPAPVLMASDLAAEGAAERLLALVPGLRDPRDRRTVLAAVALSRVLRGKPADTDLEGTGDGRLIAALTAARAGKAPGKIAAEAEEPPHIAVQQAALTVLMRSAWARGDAEAVRRAGGALLLLAPRHPEAQIIAVAVLAATPAVADDAVLMRAGEIPREKRDPVIRALAALVPARQAALAKRFPKVLDAKP